MIETWLCYSLKLQSNGQEVSLSFILFNHTHTPKTGKDKAEVIEIPKDFHPVLKKKIKF